LEHENPVEKSGAKVSKLIVYESKTALKKTNKAISRKVLTDLLTLEGQMSTIPMSVGIVTGKG